MTAPVEEALLAAPVSPQAAGRLSTVRRESFAAGIAARVSSVLMRAQIPPEERDFVMLSPNGAPFNPVTQHVFTGLNRLALTVYLLEGNFADPRFVTFQQAGEVNTTDWRRSGVRKGEQSIELLRPQLLGSRQTVGGAATGALDDRELLTDLADLPRLGFGQASAARVVRELASGDRSPRVFMRAFHVFHASQVEHMPPLSAVRAVRMTPGRDIEQFLGAMGVAFRVEPAQTTPARYDCERDEIVAPPRQSAPSREAYWTQTLQAAYAAVSHPTRRGYGAAGTSDAQREAWAAAFFAVNASMQAGLQPHLSALDVPAAPGDQADRLTKAAHDALPVIDAFHAVLHGRHPEAAWWPSDAPPAVILPQPK